MRGAVAFDAALVGIHSGGAWLAERLAHMVEGEHPLGSIDVSFYRDDYAQKGLRAKLATTTLPLYVEGSRIILRDDLHCTGGSVHRAVNAIFASARARTIELPG